MRRSKGGTYEALLHPLSDFTNPNESHILPHSCISIGTWGFRIIRIDPYYQLSSYYLHLHQRHVLPSLEMGG
jgi:hypothetical protein